MITYDELNTFMERTGLTWYGTAQFFGLSMNTVYRWKRSAPLVGIGPSRLTNNPVISRMMRTDIAVVYAMDQSDSVLSATDCHDPESLRSIVDKFYNRAGVVICQT